jgi:hypothetical protein
VRRRQGSWKRYYDADSVFVLWRSSRVVSAVGRSSPRGEKERAMVTSGAVRRRPMGGSGRAHREGEWDEKEASKVRWGSTKRTITVTGLGCPWR